MTEDTTAAAAGKAQKKRAPRSKKPGTPLSKLIVEAVATNQSRKGTSIQAIKKFLSTKGVDTGRMNSRINLAVVRLVKNGVLRQLRGVGASGSFMLAKKTLQAKPARKTKTTSKPRTPKTPKKTTKKSPAKKTTAKKTATKKSPAKKTTTKKTATKKTATKKTTTKKTATKKTATKKTATKKTATKKTTTKKTATKKTTTKKSPAKKTATKKTTTRKPAVKRSIKPKKSSGARKATPTKRLRAKK